MSNIMKAIKKILGLFEGGEWKVLYKKKDSPDLIEFIGDSNYWYADPFLVDYDNKTFLFVEAFNKKTQVGEIAVSVMRNGVFSEPTVIIKNEYHMSYPDVFAYGDHVYMLPESGESNNLELYEAIDFPYTWRKHILMKNVYLADSTVYIKDKIYIYAYNDIIKATDLYILDIDNKMMKHICRKQNNNKRSRPAGQLFYINGGLFRPTQNCEKTYGGSLIINKVLNLEGLEENLYSEIYPNEISPKYDRMHTLNFSNNYVCVDVFVGKKGLGCFIGKIKRKIHRIKMKRRVKK